MALNYEPLDVESYEIRMLTILPATPDSIVRCTLEKTNLISPAKYAALSYCWGDPNITTNICINNVEIAVTVNLADALQKLRLLGVTRVWADALCINQADRQEKSHQIRNMKLVYSKADETYSWLGREGTDGSTAAMLFLETLLLAQDESALADVPHTHTPRTDYTSPRPSDAQPASMIVAPPSTHETAIQNVSCQRCLREARFRALHKFFERPYWKRRWVIQEIAVSSRVEILCGRARMTLRDMEAAITLCRRSCYWHAETEMLYLFIQRIMEFRHAYQAQLAPSLCKAITMSQKFISTDPRDIFFALLGICHDGLELVPTPNYQQPVEVIARDITRALLPKKKYLEIVLLNRLTETGIRPAPLPSWVPVGFTADLPEDSYALANKKLASWGEMQMPDAIAANCDTFQVLGLTIGTIVAATSTTDRKGISEGSLSQSFEPIQSSDTSAPPTAYYKSDSETLAALFSCLITREKYTMGAWARFHSPMRPSAARSPKFVDRVRFHMVWHACCLYLAGRNITRWSMSWSPLTCCLLSSRKAASHGYDVESAEDKDLVMQGLFVQWFEANATFMVQGRALKEWTKLHNFWIFLMGMFDSLAGLTLICVVAGFELTFGLYMEHVIRISQGHLIAIALCLIVLGVAKLSFFVIYRYKVFHLLRKIWVNMPGVLQTPKKLVLSDKGFTGMAGSEAQPGDKICFLAGRNSPVVLRERRRGDRMQYTVVGESYVYLSVPDRKSYSGFIDQKTDKELINGIYFERRFDTILCVPRLWAAEDRSRECVNAEERRRCIERYREEGMLQRFELV
jgi:hypothetical protein